jgi:DinB superfamily
VNHCDECGFVYADHGTDTVVDEISGLAARYGTRLRVPSDETDLREALRRRPEPDVWSALEYACHVRDVLLAQRERLFLTLVENRPSFAPIYRDRRVVLARYSEEKLEQVAAETELAVRLISWAFAGLDPADWDRLCIYNFPEPAEQSVLWLAQHTLHEGEHHLQDIDRVIAMTTRSSRFRS